MSPPRRLRSLIRYCLPSDDRIELTDALDTLYAGRVAIRGRTQANIWYARQALGFVVRIGPLRLFTVLGPLDSLSGDIRVATRFLARRTGYVAAFVLTLGIGAGVLSTVYLAANWVLLRPVPGVRHPEQLVTLRLGMRGAPPQVSFDLSNPDLVTLSERIPASTQIAGSSPVDVDVRANNGDPARAAGELITANYFQVLETRLIAGRAFTVAENGAPSGSNTVVLSDDLARRWSRDVASLVGSVVRVNGAPFTVIGITESGFRGAELPGRAELWFPLSALPALDPTAAPTTATDRGAGTWHRMIERMPAGANTAAAVATANGVMEAVRREYHMHSYTAKDFTFQAFDGVGLDPSVRASVRKTLSLVALACAFLTLLAIANLANLTLMQATVREGNLALRVALGAGRARLARSVLIETLFLGLSGGGAALILARVWGRWFDGATLSQYGGSLSGMRFDLRVVSVTLAVAMVAAIAATSRHLLALRGASFDRLLRTASVRAPSKSRAQPTLVAIQVALSLMLVVGAGLLGRTVANLQRINLGFSPERLLTFAVDPHLHGFEGARLAQLAVGAEQKIAADPRVVSAGFISPSPLTSSYFTGSLYTSSDPAVRPIVGAIFFVTPSFLQTLGAKVLAGQQVWSGDSGSMVISRGMLAKAFPGAAPADVIGRMVPSRSKGQQPLRIAAVIEDVQLSDITSAAVPTMFRPLSERIPGQTVNGFVRTIGSPGGSMEQVRQAMQAVAPDLPLFAMEGARQVVDRQFAEQQVMALASTTLGILGLILAAIGLYGVLTAVVLARRREIGISVALGASPGRVRSTVLLNGLRPTAAGIILGLAGAIVLGKLLKSQLYGIAPLDLSTYVLAVASLVAVVVVTCLVPAHRATRVDPAEVLRVD